MGLTKLEILEQKGKNFSEPFNSFLKKVVNLGEER
jgi:hypothetical protein